LELDPDTDLHYNLSTFELGPKSQTLSTCAIDATYAKCAIGLNYAQ